MLHTFKHTVKRQITPWSVGACVVALGLSSEAVAQIGDDTTNTGSGDVMRVEEDWEAVLNEPGANLSAPQFHTVMSPLGHTDSYHFQAVWNYRELPNYQNGGLQVLAWDGENEAGSKSFREDALSSAAETVSWTQVLKYSSGALTFRIKDGQSTTWSSFGGTEARLSGTVYIEQNLNGYSPSVSVGKSWITYGSNRVSLLRIKAIRYYNVSGVLLQTDSAPKVVFPLSQ